MKLEKYSIGVGDRFGLEGVAQLRALQAAGERGVQIVPVWNKSNREHTLIGTSPGDARKAAVTAVKKCRWTNSYYVDADHIGLGNVDPFLAACNYFTIDIADFIGKPADPVLRKKFIDGQRRFVGELSIPGIERTFQVSVESLGSFADKYLCAITEAGHVYRYIAGKKGGDGYIIEVSVDEASQPQTPIDLFFILAAIAAEGIPVQTIAPKFSGSFLKGIDYVGDLGQFTREFEDDIAVLGFAVRSFNLSANLKLSVHSGSDKFSLYPIIRRAIMKSDTGIHLKTAGTTWLEEVIGLAAAGKDGLQLAQEIYAASFMRFDELAKPYLPVIAIDKSKLPHPKEVDQWDSNKFVDTLRHDQSNPLYNIHFRQLLHIGFKIAAEMGDRFIVLLNKYRDEIEANVTYNIFDRHILPLFIGEGTEDRNPVILTDAKRTVPRVVNS